MWFTTSRHNLDFAPPKYESVNLLIFDRQPKGWAEDLCKSHAGTFADSSSHASTRALSPERLIAFDVGCVSHQNSTHVFNTRIVLPLVRLFAYAFCYFKSDSRPNVWHYYTKSRYGLYKIIWLSFDQLNAFNDENE